MLPFAIRHSLFAFFIPHYSLLTHPHAEARLRSPKKDWQMAAPGCGLPNR
jgi:hypothetical protein